MAKAKSTGKKTAKRQPRAAASKQAIKKPRAAAEKDKARRKAPPKKARPAELKRAAEKRPRKAAIGQRTAARNAARPKVQKAAAKRPPAQRPRRVAAREVPEDNPRRRFQEVVADHFFGTPPRVSHAAQRFSALAHSRTMSPAHEMVGTPVTPGFSNWVPLGPLAIPNGQTYGGPRVIVTGRVIEIVVDPAQPNTIYAASARGGIWKTTDGGVKWAPKSDNEQSLALGALAIAASNPQILYAGTGEGNIFYYTTTAPLNSLNESYEGVGILKTTNGGDSWVLQGHSIFQGACFFRIAIDPIQPDTAFAASNLGLYRTTDGGTNWIAVTSGLPPISATVVACTDVAIDPSNPSTVYAAFWGDGIYKTTNAGAATPSWTKLGGGLPTSNQSRISVAISPTSPQNVYAEIADASDQLNGIFTSANGGASWTSIPSGPISVYGAYTSKVTVDISTPDVIYIAGVSLYKAVRTMGTWTVTDVGGGFHPDNHAFATHPTDHLTVFAGSDGGLYKSIDGGTTWIDSVNEGICATQFEFLGQHPSSDAFVIGGTQDNGSEIFRNSPAFYHSADGDGGSAGVDASNPRYVIHTYYGASPERSNEGGDFGTYTSISSGLSPDSLFYPPLAYDETNSQNVAFGTDVVSLDSAQGTGGWPVSVSLPGSTGLVSAISYVNSSLIYAGTSSGEVYRLTKSGSTWTANSLTAAPLPARWIWEVSTLPGNVNAIVVAMSGFGTPHVWKGAVSASGTSATWSDASGTGFHRLPDVPVNGLCVEPANSKVFYAGTDVGVFRTVDGGSNWELFNNGLPNTAVYDLKLHSPTRLLRAATHGRGLWERKLDVQSLAKVDLYVRDNLMATGRIIPTPSPITATYTDPLQGVTVGDQLWWYMCADVKIDAPSPTTHTYQMPVSAVDYLAFETKLAHRNPERGVINRVYVQVHNRGIQPATNVTVKILYADASPGLPDLPANFWTAFPGNGTTTVWHPIGAAKTIPSISPTRPEVIEWDWVPPASAAQHSCLLVVVDSAENPIPAANKVFAIAPLVTHEKRVGLRNLNIIDSLAPMWNPIRLFGGLPRNEVLRFSSLPAGWSLTLLLPARVSSHVRADGFKAAHLTSAQIAKLKEALGDKFSHFDPKLAQSYSSGPKGALITSLDDLDEFDVPLMFTAGTGAVAGSVTVVRESGTRVLGGNSFSLVPS
jgi:photosystem II stability/assembly factor-like uncharacterized protein